MGAISLPPTIETIAALAGVSRTTVSRVLNNHPNVRADVRERIQRVIAEQGYAPRAAARSLASKRTGLISVLTPRSPTIVFSDPLYPVIAQGIVEVCAARGYFAMLPLVTRDMELDFLRHVLHSHQFDGIISTVSDVDDPMLSVVSTLETPLVRLGRHPYLHNLSWVDADNLQGSYMATHHLLQLGHRRIATITGPLIEIGAVDRRDGYKQALMEAGIGIAPELIVEADWTREGGYRAMRRLLAVGPRPSAVFVANDVMSAGAMGAIREAGLAIPGDIAVVGYDDMPIAASLSPPLTTVRQPLGEMGRAMAVLLVEQIETRRLQPVHRIFPTELVVRASCGAASGAASGAVSRDNAIHQSDRHHGGS